MFEEYVRVDELLYVLNDDKIQAIFRSKDYNDGLSKAIDTVEHFPRKYTRDNFINIALWVDDELSPGRHKCSCCGTNPHDNEHEKQYTNNYVFKEYLTKFCFDCGSKMINPN